MKRLIARFALFISALSVSVEAQSQCTPDITPPVVTPSSIAITQGSIQTVNINLPCSYIHLSPPTSPDWDPAATDVCDASLTQTLELSGATIAPETPSTTLTGQTFNRGTTQVIWRFKDDRLPVPNVAFFVFTVVVVDNVPPTILCPAPVNANTSADGLGDCTTAVSLGSASASDNCLYFPVSNNAPVDFYTGVTTVTWTVYDLDSNVATCSQLVTIIDNENPVAVCKDTTLYLSDAGTASVLPSEINNGSNDNCGIELYSLNNSSFNCSDIPSNPITIILTVTDSSGLTHTCPSLITIIDDTPPVITCPADITQPNDLNLCSASVTVPLLISADSCGIASVVNSFNVGGANASDVYPVGTTTVLYTVTDFNGNSTTCSTDIVVNDTENPDIICPSNVIVSTDPGLCEANITIPLLVSSDECGILSIINDYNSNGADASDVYPRGVTTVSYTVTDIHNNTSSCSFTITVNDNELPNAICKDTILNLDSLGLASVLPIEINNGSSDNCGIELLSLSITNFSCADIPSSPLSITLSVTDSSGNVQTCPSQITLIDAISPVIECPADTSLNNDPNSCDAIVSIPLLVSNDACGIVSVTNSFNANGADASDVYPVGITTVIFTITDNNSNSTTCSMTVTVLDDEQPDIVCPNDTTLSNDPGMCDALVALPVLINSDECGILSVVNDYNANGADASDTYPVGVTPVTFTVTDVNLNVTTCSMTITVLDDEQPDIVCPNDTTLSNDPGMCDAQVSLPLLINSDECGILTIVNDYNANGADASDTYPVGITAVTFTVTDVNSNVSTCAMLVTVLDTELPLITCTQSDTVIVSSDSGDCSYLHTGTAWDATIATDNCDASPVIEYQLTDVIGNPLGSGVSLDQFSFSGLTNVTWTATDIYGNIGTCTFVVLVEDSVAPILSSCTSDQIVNSDPLACTFNVPNSSWDISGTDNCGAVSFEYILSGATVDTVINSLIGVEFNLGLTIVEATLYDGAGNTDICLFNVEVSDNELPIITTCGAIIDTTVLADAGGCTYTNAGIGWDALATDNCSIDGYSYTLTGATIASGLTTLDGLEFELDTTLVTWIATDGSGNTTTCSFNVIVEDTELPIITSCGAIIDTIVIADAGVCTYTNTGFGWDALASDNCSIDSYSYTLTGATVASGLTTLDGLEFELDTTLVTWTATDGSGNTISCSFKVIVEDAELPIIATCGAIIDTTVIADSGVCSYTNAGIGWDALATDNCSIDGYSYTLTGATIASGLTTLDGLQFELDTTLVTWTATDGSGNTISCSFNVIVEDAELPIITTCGVIIDTTVLADAGVCTYTNNGFGWDALATDNCSIDSISYVLSGATEASGLTTLDGIAFSTGSTDVNWTATDGSGNTTTCSFNVIVIDDQAPIIAPVLPDTMVECSPVAPLAADNCGPVTGISDFTTYSGDTIVVVTWTFTDASGNSATSSQTIIYDDVTAPDAIIIADAVAECDTTVSAATTMDNCMGTITGTTIDPLTYSDQGTYTITWTFDDGNDNTSTATQTVIIQDVTAPSITAPTTVNVYPNNAGCTATGIDLGIPITSDNCQVTSVVNDGLTVYPLGATTVIWVVTDIAGNTTSASQTVNVLPLTSTLDTVACDVYVSPDGIDLTSFGSGIYTSVIPGSFGCDSTITINLTLNQSTTSEISLSSCETYSAPDGQVYTNSGIYTAIIPNTQGCDSTITINLTIDSIETIGIQLNELVFTANQSNLLYQWVNCENNYTYVAGATQQTFEPLQSGDYAVILTYNTCIDTSECLTIDIDLLVPQVVTPNGDGKNDVFEIQGIYDHPDNVLDIYNRWGSLVYRQEGYQNTWGGECTEGISIGGNILPTGTYFYILDLGDGDGAKPSKGYIFLTK